MSSFGFDFRASSGFVTDPSTCTYVVEGTTYPTTRTVNGTPVTFGITQQVAGQSRDRDAGIDARLAGQLLTANGDSSNLKFRVDLPSAGTYTINLALGDYINGRENTLKIWDNTTLKTTVSGTTVSGSFTDATGVSRTAAAWPGSNASISVTFATTTAIFELAPPGAGELSSLAHIFITSAATPATLSSPTPSGTLGTSTTAAIGATTDQASGTLYAILSTTQADVTGATAANIKAGQKSGGSAAAFSGNAAVSTTSPSISISGLTASTTYYYAVIQNNTNGDSNILSTGSFTTAGATAVLSSATPSGTIGTQTTASIGATTTQASGTLYAIASTVQADVTGASAANIKAGQIASGSAAPFSGNAAVSTTTPSVAITGLNAATLYYYAIIQNNGSDSNIINTGSFTTSAPSPTGPINFDCDTTGAATTTFVPDTGSAARAIIAVLSHEQVNGTRPVASLTIGGVSFTKLSDSIYGQGTSYAYTEIWYCFESSISAMGYSPSVAVTATSTGNKFVSGTLFTVSDVPQNASLWSWLGDTKAVGTTLNMDLPAGNTWKVVGGATSTIGGNAFTTGASVTEVASSDRNFNSSGSRAVSFSGTASGSTININTGSTSTNTAMSQSLFAVAFPPLASRSVSITLRDDKNALLNAKNRRFWTRATLDAVAVDGGSSGISVVCGADGVFTLSGLSISSGAGYLTMSDPSDTSKSHNFYVTFA